MKDSRDNAPRNVQASIASNEKSKQQSRTPDLAVRLLREPLGSETAQQLLQQLTAANDNHPQDSGGR